jgi:ABC-type Fe3+/spermidine/putrescine transport system ATPase subunit
VAENVGYALKLKKLARRERRERVGEAMATARIDGFGDRIAETLNPQQVRRVATARALINEPDLLVIDDPASGLDARVRAEVHEDLRRVAEEARVGLLVMTSDAREALELADRMAVIDFGRIVQEGTPGEVYNHPSDTFVARMLGPINLIQGQSDSFGSRGEIVVRTPLGRLIGRPARDRTFAPGTSVTVAIRPEALALGSAVPGGWNRFAATVERLALQGATRQVSLRGPGDWPVSALALQATSEGLRPGQSLTVAVPPEFVVVLPSRLGPSDSAS